jgi:hypothetical protein
MNITSGLKSTLIEADRILKRVAAFLIQDSVEDGFVIQ